MYFIMQGLNMISIQYYCIEKGVNFLTKFKLVNWVRYLCTKTK